MNKSLIRSRWAAVGAAVAVTLGGGTFMVAKAAVAPDLVFTAITPCRLLDTRSDVDPVATSKVENLGIRKGVVKDKTNGNQANNDITVIFDKDAANNGSTNNFTLQYGNTDFRPILGDCDVQFDSGDLVGVTPSALLLNVTTVNMSQNGFVTVYPWQSLSNTGTSVSNRPFYSNLNPIAASAVPSVSNNVTVMLAAVGATTYIPNVKCAAGSHSSDGDGDGIFSGSDCGGFDGFRVYNENGTTHVIIDVLGYYDGLS